MLATTSAESFMKTDYIANRNIDFTIGKRYGRGAFDSAENYKRQRRKRQSVTAKREKSQTPKFV